MKKSIIIILSVFLIFACSKKEETKTEETLAISGNQITLTDLQKKHPELKQPPSTTKTSATKFCSPDKSMFHQQEWREYPLQQVEL